ncbi:CDP-glycerol glycerophosphotransferase family protein [Psychromonas sp. 14N.309.X.WAT.B.A12]|uniref:CDP-glycerol glycerophosphotransferase family protein n=1 Tax=unclassified Psychromonas TaxID=2614957 RepID=UPI0025AEDB8C|nr:CDP-glycerol glycerophosphotransferase family protein [Psychromonas sp. 14N.309.X.WAT.B.A12]MDN2664641.1 CDP-glycerol glycerophosphotransferase family protein [Psychromonas sp. 14N.309.X.WAT.B.A12]
MQVSPSNTERKSLKFLFYVEQNYAFDILRPIQIEAINQGYQVKWLIVGNDASTQYLRDDEQMLASIDDAIAFKSDAVFVPGNHVPRFIPGIKVQVFHGLNQSKRGNVYPERGLFDLYCTEGPQRTGMLLEAIKDKAHCKVVETGWVKLDALFRYQSKETFSRPQILFSSTFSTSLSCAELVYDEIKRLSKDSQWQWLVTLHPKMAKQTVQKYKDLQGENLVFFGNDQVIEALHRADLMICDNSSIFQEFLLLNKPVITVNNRSPLDCFINITEAAELKGAIQQALSPSSALIEQIKAYGPAITPFLDGNSSSRILSAVEEMIENDWQDTKPRNFIQNIKMRKKLKYWKH